MTTSVTLTEYDPEEDDVVAASVSQSVNGGGQTGLPESVSWRVTRSWELVSAKLEKVGIDFFLRVFEERPDLLELFHFGGADISRGNLPPALKNHAMIVMKAIGLCVSGLTALDTLIPTLRSLGGVHRTAGVLEEHYEVIFNHLMDAIAAELGPENWDADMRDAWELVFRSLTTVMKSPEDLLQIEPMEGWGMANALACCFICFYTPFQMAGFSSRNEGLERILNISTLVVICVVTLDMCSHWLMDQVRHRRSSDRTKKSRTRRAFDRVTFTIRFRYSRFIRSLKMDQWAHWPRVDAVILCSFAFQFLSQLSLGHPQGYFNQAGVHWTFAVGLLRLVAAYRLLHFLQCAENNLMLRVRMEPDERQYLLVAKLCCFMVAVIHVAACIWNIVARLELGPSVVDPTASSFFPDPELMLGSSGIFNSYLHSIHWAWVNLAGIGDIDSSPQTTLECLTTLLVHICGATLYTIATGNVVAVLEVLSAQQTSLGTDLADIGELMQNCHVSGEDQKRILQAYMMHNLVKKRGTDDGGYGDSGDSATTIPSAVDRLPPHIRLEVVNYVRAEAVKRRDPAFRHCSQEFLFSMCGGLTGTTLLLPGDYLFREGDKVANGVVFVEKGKIEVISNGAAIRMLQRGDVIGKRWLLDPAGEKTSGSKAETTLRAHSGCTLSTGLADVDEVNELRRRYENDFYSLEAGRTAINKSRKARMEHQRLSNIKRMSSLAEMPKQERAESREPRVSEATITELSETESSDESDDGRRESKKTQ